MFTEGLGTAISQLENARMVGALSRFALIGGLAVSRWGFVRSTVDVDFAVALGSATLQKLAESVGGTHREGAVSDPLLGSVSFEAKTSSFPVPIELLVFPRAWEDLVFEDPSSFTIGDLTIPVADWSALVLLKLYAGGPLDREDARQILLAQNPTKTELSALMTRATRLRVSKKLSSVLSK